MEHWCNDTDKGRQKSCEKHLPQYHFVYHKLQTDWPGIEPIERPVTNQSYRDGIRIVVRN